MSARLRGRVVSGSLFGCFRAAAVASRRRPLERDQDEDRAAHRGLHLAGRAGELSAGPAKGCRGRGGCGVYSGQRDGPRLADRRARAARARDAGGLHHARVSRGVHLAGRVGVVGDGGGLPGAGTAGQVRHHPRRLVRRAGPGSASGQPGTRRRRAAWGCRSRPPPSGSSGWRRRCRSSCRCAAATRARTRASTTRLSAPSTRRSRCAVRTHRS